MSIDGHLAVTVTDDAVEFVFGVENSGSEPIELEFRSGQLADDALESDGAEVWCWSAR